MYARVDQELAAVAADAGHHHISVALRLNPKDQKGPVDTVNITYSATSYVCKLYSRSIERLSEYSHIIVDEVHERTFENDMLCFLLKALLQSTKSTVKVLLLSATVDYGLYRNYFSTPTTPSAAASVSPEPLYVGGTRFSCEFFHIGAASLKSSTPSAASIPLQQYQGLQTDVFQAWCGTVTRECDVNNIVLRPTTIRKQMQIARTIINAHSR